MEENDKATMKVSYHLKGNGWEIESVGYVRRYYYHGILRAVGHCSQVFHDKYYDRAGNLEREDIYDDNCNKIVSIVYHKGGSFNKIHSLYNGHGVIEYYNSNGELYKVEYSTTSCDSYIIDIEKYNKK